MHGAGEGVALQGIRSNANCNNNDLGKFVMYTHNGDVVFFVLDKGLLVKVYLVHPISGPSGPIFRESQNRLLDHPALSLQQCTVSAVDVHCGERMLSDHIKSATYRR